MTGTSVLGIKYDKGIMIAADNLGMLEREVEMGNESLMAASYGSLARFKDIQRLHPLGSQTVIGVAGDMSDFQYLKKQLDSILSVHFCWPSMLRADVQTRRGCHLSDRLSSLPLPFQHLRISL